MKTCPNCKELVGDNVSKCFNCGWNFDDPLANERAIEQRQLQIKQETAAMIEKERTEAEKKIKALRHIQELNDLYEYDVVPVVDEKDGSANIYKIKQVINEYSSQRWRLISILTNEIGKNSTSSGYGGFTNGTNATIDQTILVFERRKDKPLT